MLIRTSHPSNSFAIFPGVQSAARAVLMSSRPLILGHRGCCARAPENTIPSFELAVRSGVDLVELDYHQTKDGVPVVIHDSTLDRTIRSAKGILPGTRVQDLTAAELTDFDAGSWFDPAFRHARLPTLAEALDCICGGGGLALIEHKSGDPYILTRVLARNGWLEKSVVISFDWNFLARLHRAEPALLIGALGPPMAHRKERPSRSGIRGRLNTRWLELMKNTGAAIAVWNARVSPVSIRLAHQRGLKVWVYTIDSPRKALQLIQMGVDGIITNDPVGMPEAIRELSPQK